MHAAGNRSPLPADRRTDKVAALLRAITEAFDAIPDPALFRDPRTLQGYLGDVVEITLNGEEPERAALLAKLLLLCAASSAPDGRSVTRWLLRLERLLRGWDGERRAGAAPPRPGPDDLEASVAMLHVARANPSLMPVTIAAFELAELAAIHVVCGATSVEQALAAADQLAPLIDEARALLDRGDQQEAIERPGATLAYLAHAAGNAIRVLNRGSNDAQRGCGVPLLLELAAGLLSAHDAHEQQWDHDRSWRIVRDRAIELIAVGELAHDPAAVDLSAVLDEAQAAAVALGGQWLDELYGDGDGDGDGEGDLAGLGPRMLEASSRCLVAAWARQPVL